jgi:hypothetical protein
MGNGVSISRASTAEEEAAKALQQMKQGRANSASAANALVQMKYGRSNSPASSTPAEVQAQTPKQGGSRKKSKKGMKTKKRVSKGKPRTSRATRH